MELTIQAVQRGERAHVMLCGSASGLAREHIPDDANVLLREAGNSPKELLARIVAERLVSAEVCSIQTTHVTGLLAGISPADLAVMAKRLFFAKAKYGDKLHVLSF